MDVVDEGGEDGVGHLLVSVEDKCHPLGLFPEGSVLSLGAVVGGRAAVGDGSRDVDDQHVVR